MTHFMLVLFQIGLMVNDELTDRIKMDAAIDVAMFQGEIFSSKSVF